MDAGLQACLTFHLMGRTPGADLPAIDALDLRPALLAGYRDLTALRYDFPVVLVQSGNDTVFVHSLSGLIDDLLRDIASGEAGERVTRHVLRLERQIRTLVAQGEAGLLSDLWSTAAGRLGARSDDQLRDSLDRARAALRIDGEVVDCDAALASRLLTHAWKTTQQQKARRFHDKVNAVIVQLSELLRADAARSNEGRSPQNLRASVGPAHQDVFDFDAMSRLLATIAPGPAPPDRSKRIGALIATLESQRFYPAADRLDARDARVPYTFVFESCSAALAAYRERLPAVMEMAKAIALAELEIGGTIADSARLGLVDALDADDVGQQDLTLFPDYLVLLRGDDMDPVEQTTTIEVLGAGLPMKVLVQTDDLYDGRSAGHLGDGARGRRLATIAMGLNDVYVLQSSASQLFQFRERIMRGISGPGSALFSVFSGAVGASTDLPPYLVAAAAMESRAFPAFVYDPTAGPDWASRLDVQANPQANADWPVRRLTYEDTSHQRIAEDVAFTLVDFLSCDRRYGRHLAGAPLEPGTGGLVPVSEWLAVEPAEMPTSIPAVWMADRDNVLHRVVVDAKLVRAARRCREAWHSLQELGGIHNSHAQRLLARERQARQDDDARERRDRATHAHQAVGATSESVPGAAPAETSAPAPAAVSNQEEARSPDEPYIETPRCSTCNECIQINGRMFAYNVNKQAYIADPSAGTYRQLVEAAESCQVSVIHPGKPRDPSEPGLEELLLRAGPFQ